MTETIIVKTKSPVEDTSSYLYKWDSSARKYFSAFEQYTLGLKSGIDSLRSNPLTSFKDPV